MKTIVFCCLPSCVDSKGRQMHVRARLTLDSSDEDVVDVDINPGSLHHSCNHSPTQIEVDEHEHTRGSREGPGRCKHCNEEIGAEDSSSAPQFSLQFVN